MVPCHVRQHVFSRAPSLIERPRGPRLAPPTPTIRIIACAGVSPMAATATLSRAPCMRCAESRAGQLLQVSACRMVRKRQKRKCRVAAYFAASILRDPSGPESTDHAPIRPAAAKTRVQNRFLMADRAQAQARGFLRLGSGSRAGWFETEGDTGCRHGYLVEKKRRGRGAIGVHSRVGRRLGGSIFFRRG